MSSCRKSSGFISVIWICHCLRGHKVSWVLFRNFLKSTNKIFFFIVFWPLAFKALRKTSRFDQAQATFCVVHSLLVLKDPAGLLWREGKIFSFQVCQAAALGVLGDTPRSCYIMPSSSGKTFYGDKAPALFRQNPANQSQRGLLV